VENLYETKEFANLCKTFYDWNQKGYTNKDIQTQTDSFPVLTRNDAAFCTMGQVDFNTAYYQTTACGKEMGVVALGEPLARTYNNVAYTVMSNTDHAEACMKFLNLWFSDKELGTLISYGIEGQHYTLDANGMGAYLDGQDAKSCTYHLGSNLSNINRILWKTENPKYAELLVDSNKNAKKSVALGFAFDTSNVTNEITQLDNVRSKYENGLECGTLDPDANISKFVQELKAAGLDKVIAEKQRQLEEFLKK
ncbi:MAG: ABC transporter substrate-binding protein, partial [Lachnospira sp.]|nr:ABC transporter substrate-binding protein [Lachnospira sp.]